MEITREKALTFITSKGTISSPGVYRVKVTNVTPYSRMIGDGLRQVAIANVNAKTDYHNQVAATLFAQGDYAEAANQGLSKSILEGQFCPMKGQMVDIVVEQITTKNGVTGLFIQDMSPAPIEQPRKETSDAFLALLDVTKDQVNVLNESEVEAPFQPQING